MNFTKTQETLRTLAIIVGIIGVTASLMQYKIFSYIFIGLFITFIIITALLKTKEEQKKLKTSNS